MISLSISDPHLTTSPHTHRLPEFLENIRKSGQGFFELPDDTGLITRITDYARTLSHIKYLLVLGIGGSALGTLCIKESLTHLYKSTSPQMYVLDNIDPEMMAEVEDAIKYEHTLIIVISKSGTTPETLAQYCFFREKLERAQLPLKNHLVIITDPEKGILRQIAHTENLTSFPIPKNVGGRFSVLSAVGLLPAALLHLPIAELLEGARAMREGFFSEDPEKNLPFQLALIKYEAYQKGKRMHVMMPYVQKLYRFADWYRQLLAESIGKTPEIGITPINALGATDQHSQSQLYNDGPNDKLYTFLTVETPTSDPMVPYLLPDTPEFSFLKDITFKKLLDTEYAATRSSLSENSRPSLALTLTRLDALHLGMLFMLFEAEIALLGELFGVNAFDQPGVERSKELVRGMLDKKA